MFNKIPQIKNICDIEEIEKTPITKRIPFQNTFEVFQYCADKFEDRHAIRFIPKGQATEQPVELSYRALFKKITQAANLFKRMGLGEQETISYILPNIPQTHYCIWGGEAVGIVSAINPFLEAETIAHILQEGACKILVVPSSGDIWEKVKTILDRVPTLQCVLQIDLSQFDHQDSTDTSNTLSLQNIGALKPLNFDTELEKQPADHLSFSRVIQKNNIAAYFHTGGTMGNPKLAMHTHFNQVCNAWVISALSVDHHDQSHDIIISGLPLFHVNAIMVTGLGAFMRGATVIMAGLNGYRSPDVLPNFWKLTERYKATTFSSVPTILSALINTPLADADITSLKYALCGAAPLSQKLFKDFENYSGTKILEGYGLTESTCVASLTPQFGQKKVGSVGLRIPYQQIKVVALDEQGNFVRNCEKQETGTLFIKGPNVFPGYKQQEKTAAAFDNDGWLNTGDLAQIDGDNYIWLTGRAKDLIIRGGHNIDPATIEEALIQHPAIEMAAAVGQPDIYAGELPCAYVTVNSPVDPGDLLEFAKNTIAERAAIPTWIEVIPLMPVTAVGKIFKPNLRQQAAARVFQTVLRAANVEGVVKVQNNKKSTPTIQIETSASAKDINDVIGNFIVPFTIIHKPTQAKKSAV